MILCGLYESAQIFGEARATEAWSGMEKFAADTIVKPDAAGDFLNIGADFFTEIGNFVDEGDLGRQKRIGGIFDELGGSPAGVENRCVVEI